VQGIWCAKPKTEPSGLSFSLRCANDEGTCREDPWKVVDMVVEVVGLVLLQLKKPLF
jgi:hypothetical protein